MNVETPKQAAIRLTERFRTDGFKPTDIYNYGTYHRVRLDHPDKGKIIRPASLRLRIQDPACVGLGNLIRPSGSEPSHQVFVCGNQLIEVPLVLETTTDGSAPR